MKANSKTIRKAILAASAALFAPMSFASMQMPDKLLFNGMELRFTDYCPFDIYMRKNLAELHDFIERENLTGSITMNTANARGYVGKYEIKDGALWMLNLDAERYDGSAFSAEKVWGKNSSLPQICDWFDAVMLISTCESKIQAIQYKKSWESGSAPGDSNWIFKFKGGKIDRSVFVKKSEISERDAGRPLEDFVNKPGDADLYDKSASRDWKDLREVQLASIGRAYALRFGRKEAKTKLESALKSAGNADIDIGKYADEKGILEGRIKTRGILRAKYPWGIFITMPSSLKSGYCDILILPRHEYDVPVLQKNRDEFRLSAGAEKILREIGEGEFAEVEIESVATLANSQTCAKLLSARKLGPGETIHSPNAPLLREHDLRNLGNELAAAVPGK